MNRPWRYFARRSHARNAHGHQERGRAEEPAAEHVGRPVDAEIDAGPTDAENDQSRDGECDTEHPARRAQPPGHEHEGPEARDRLRRVPGREGSTARVHEPLDRWWPMPTDKVLHELDEKPGSRGHRDEETCEGPLVPRREEDHDDSNKDSDDPTAPEPRRRAREAGQEVRAVIDHPAQDVGIPPREVLAVADIVEHERERRGLPLPRRCRQRVVRRTGARRSGAASSRSGRVARGNHVRCRAHLRPSSARVSTLSLARSPSRARAYASARAPEAPRERRSLARGRRSTRTR